MDKEKVKGIFANLLVLQASILVILIALEIVLRVFPNIDLEVNNPYKYTKFIGEQIYGVPYRSYTEAYPLCFDSRKYYKKSNGVVKYYFNQLGARWVEARDQDLKGRNAIVAGDSITFGFGLRYEDSYIFKLQDLLREDGIYLNFINYSRPGADARKCLDIYKEKSGIVPHDIFIYGLHLNDLINFPTSYIACNVSRYNPRLLKKKKWDRVIYKGTTWLKIKYRLADFVLKRIEKKNRKEKIQELISQAQARTDYFIDNMNAIKRMSLEANQKNVKFFVIVLPILVDVNKATLKPLYDEIKSLLTTYGIQYFDLSEGISSRKDSDLWVLPFDQHPNEVANTLFANRLRVLLEEAIRGQ